MAMALMLGPINAAAIDSGAAAAGEVLTADGAGGAAWRASNAGTIFTMIVMGLLVALVMRHVV